jgi:hypothetical protein
LGTVGVLLLIAAVATVVGLVYSQRRSDADRENWRAILRGRGPELESGRRAFGTRRGSPNQ